MSHWGVLVERAFEHAEAWQANGAISAVREQVRARHGDAWSIEVVIDDEKPPGRTAKALRSQLAPVLEARHIDRGYEGPVFFSVFLGERLFFVHGGAFMEALDLVDPVPALPGP